MVSNSSTDDKPLAASDHESLPPNIAVYPKLRLQQVEDKLIANLQPAKERKYLTEVQLQFEINRDNFAKLEFDLNAVKDLLKQAKINDTYSIPIASMIDAALIIRTSTDKQVAYAEHVPACGGMLLDESKIRSFLDAAKIASECVDEKNLQFLLEQESHFSLKIAKGRPAINGENTEFIPLVKKRKSLGPSINESDNADYFDADMYPNVLEGDHLMKRSSATEGLDGIDVFGKVLKSKKGKDTKFKKQKGSAIDPENDSILVATQKGHPMVSEQGVKVDDILVLQNADLQTGHVVFDGSVMISGNVMSQVKIDVTGDIHVKGTIENAYLKAGNDILVGGGVISESIPDVEERPKITTVLDAGNDIRAMFFNLTDARAGNDIVIQKYVMHSNIYAKRNILVGDRGGKGAIICGSMESGHSIKANLIGSDAYLNTVITCGTLDALKTEKSAIGKRFNQRTNERNQLLDIREKVEALDSPEKLGSEHLHKKLKINKAIEALEKRLEELDAIKEDLVVQIATALEASIDVEEKIFPRTVVSINDSSQLVTIEKRKCKIYCQDGTIKFE
ncbi:MAG: hypothetical protein ACI9FB_002713 [Candidatus Azotimanducaceae bacterium]|jgi:uncharacterized protein (DUF342 family)